MDKCNGWLLSTAEERRLIRILRRLSPEDRRMMIHLIEALLRL